LTKSTVRVSKNSTGSQGNLGSFRSSISGDGRHVAFVSEASNLLPSGVDTNGTDDVFAHDRVTGKTERVSVSTSGAQDASINGSAEPVISGDGRYVAFYTKGVLEASDTNNINDVYLRDRDTDGNGIFDEEGKVATSRQSLHSSGYQVLGSSSYLNHMSPDARFFVFDTFSRAYVPEDTNSTVDIYIRDRSAGTTTLVSKNSSGVVGNGNSHYATVSADGRYVAFNSVATNLSPSDSNGTVTDVFVRDREAGTTTLESVTPTGSAASGASGYNSMSADGRYITFWSIGSDLVSGDANGEHDIFVRDRSLGKTSIVSRSRDNGQLNYDSSAAYPSGVSADGRHLLFVSGATNVIGNEDTSGVGGSFIRDQGALSGFNLAPTLGVEPVAQSDELGLEQFHAYLPSTVGSGKVNVNLRTGNLVARFEDALIPGNGVNTAIRHGFNSSSSADVGMGKGWRLSISDLEAGPEGLIGEVMGIPSDVEGLEAISPIDASAITELDPLSPILTTSIGEIVSGTFQATGQLLEMTDGDGTTHRFVRSGGPCGRWISPPGVSLKVREIFPASPSIGLPIAYELLRPDGVVYRAEPLQMGGFLPTTEWRIVSIADRRGNRISFQYERFGLLLHKTRIRTITHNHTNSVVARFDWTSGGDLDRIVTLPGFSGQDPATGANRSWERLVDFDVDATARQLRSVSENIHATPPEGFAAASTTSFVYDANAGLSAVTDGRSQTTSISYSSGKVSRVTDRTSKEWTYSYLTQSGFTDTTVTSPVGSSTTFRVSPKGTVGGGDQRVAGRNIVSITDAGTGTPPVPIVTNYEWTANRLTKSVNGAGAESRFEYNDLGLLTKTVRAPPNATAHPDVPEATTSAVTHAIKYRYPVDFGYDSGSCSQPSSSGPVTSEGACFTAAEMIRTIASDSPSTQRRIADFHYDSVGNVTRAVQRSSGDSSTSPDSLPSLTDRAVAFSYYERGGLRTVDGARTDIADVTTWGDPADLTYGGYDRAGMPTRVTDALGKTKTFAFTPYGQVGKVTDRDGRISASRFDEADNLREVSDPAGHLTKFEYDPNGNRSKMTLPRGGFADWSYDPMDRPTVISTPGATSSDLRTTTSTTYFEDGRVATQISARGAVTNYSYWPNRLVKTVDAPAQTGGRAVTDTFYDAAGRPNRTVFPQATNSGTRPELQIVYNPNGSERIRSETSATGSMRTTSFAYSALGELIRSDGPRSVGGVDEATVNVYDPFGQVISNRRRKSSGSWLETNFAYDLAGNQTSSSQPSGNGDHLTANYTYDALNRLATQAVDPSNPGHTVDFGYNAEGNQTSRTDRLNGAPLRTITTAYNPDLTVQEVVATDVTGQSISTCNYGLGAPPNSGHDADRNLLVQRTVTGIGGCAAAITERGLNMTYDDRGWLTGISQAIRSPETGLTYSRSQSFTHHPDGTRASFTHSGQTTSYLQSPAGWQESLTDWRGEQSTISYLPSGAQASEALGSGGPRALYEWHPDGMPRSLTWTRISGQVVRRHSEISYDIAGLRTGETVEVLQPSGSSLTGSGATYAYDLVGRLTEWTGPFIDPDAGDRLRSVYTLDDGGNVTSEVITKASSGAAWESAAFSYSNGRLSQKSESRFAGPGLANQTSTTTFNYDGLGEETQRSTSFDLVPGLPGVPTELVNTTYDAAGHTKTIDETSAANRDVSYVYDTGGAVISRFDPNAPADSPKATLYFRWGAADRLVEETDGLGETVTRYLTDDDGETVAQLKYRVAAGHRDPSDTVGNWQWLLRDPSDSIATITTNDGTVQEQAAFDPYGKPAKAGSSQPDTSKRASSLGYQGSLTDKATGNLLLASRQYDPTTARFTAPDVFVAGMLDLAVGTDSLTGNRYLFAAANPVAFYEDGYAPEWLRAVGRFGKALLRNKIVRGIAIGIAIGIACGVTAGIGCAVAVGVGAGAVLGAANYAANAKGPKTLKGLGRATLKGAVEGAIEGATGAVLGKVLKVARAAKIAPRAPPAPHTSLARVADFADTQTAFSHYAKHVKGVELGPMGSAKPWRLGVDLPEFSNFREYRSAARAFMSADAPEGVMQGLRGTDLVRVDPKSGYFGVRSQEGVIRTFFRPQSDPVAYFLRQFE
jgi:RHS repeat-associated protein